MPEYRISQFRIGLLLGVSQCMRDHRNASETGSARRKMLLVRSTFAVE
jgi:hypothetical protein